MMSIDMRKREVSGRSLVLVRVNALSLGNPFASASERNQCSHRSPSRNVP